MKGTIFDESIRKVVLAYSICYIYYIIELDIGKKQERTLNEFKRGDLSMDRLCGAMRNLKPLCWLLVASLLFAVFGLSLTSFGGILKLQTAYAAGIPTTGCKYRSPPFDYWPGIPQTTGTVPLHVTATWSKNWSYVEGVPNIPPVPTLFLNWGDGTTVQIPSQECVDTDGTPFRNWPAQRLAHTYSAPGSYTIQEISQQAGLPDGVANLITIQVTSNPVTFANQNWNCATATCAQRVKAGQKQPAYQCAEFVARSLAYKGLLPGLASDSPQSAYGSYQPGNGKTYDLLLITPTSGLNTLADYLLDYGLAENIGQNLSSASVGDAVVFDDNGIPEHIVLITVMGASTSSTFIDGHNTARYHFALSNEIAGFNSWYILHIL